MPVAPVKPSAVPGNDHATVKWKAPKNNGSLIHGYRVTPFVSGTTQPARYFKSPKLSQVLVGLKNGKNYQFKVEAHNKNGWSPLSPVSGTVKIK